jgi:polar amino acid transport system substrate-binding protein
MKKQALWVMLFVILLNLSSNVVQSKPVGTKEIYDFVTILNLNQPNTILCRLVIEEAFKRNGLKTTFKTFPLKQSLEMVETGQADGDLLRLGSITWKNYIRIDEPLYSASFLAYAVREDISVQTWEDLKTNNYRIGYLAGVVKPTNIIENKLRIDESKRVLITTDDSSGFKMLLENRFDIFIIGYFPAMKVLKEKDFLSEGVRLAGSVENFNIHSFLNSKHIDLAPIIAETIREMKKDGSFDRIKETAGFDF